MRWLMRVSTVLALLAAFLLPVGAASAPRQFDILDVAFIDAQHIWVLGLPCGALPKCSAIVLRASADGGRSWQPGFKVPAQPRFLDTRGRSAQVAGLRFVTTQDAYAFGPSLLSSHDGGRTWRGNRRFHDVLALEPIDGQVWAVQGACAPANACAVHLFRSPAGQDAWKQSTLPLRSPVWSMQMVAGIRGQAWILATRAPTFTSMLITTNDGGGTWTRLPDPCSRGESVIDRLATIDGRQLWLVCGTQPSAGGELMSLFRSPDAGRHWRLIATNERKASPGRYQGVPEFVYGGYVDSLAVTGPSTAWFSLDRGTLYRTVDGGRTWRLGIRQTVSDSKVGPVLFSGPLHGWLASFPSTIFRTTNGGRSWQRIVLH